MERGVKLATYFIATVTKNSYEFKDLLHLAEHNWVNIPDDKKTLPKIPSTIFQYESVHEGKKPFNFTLCVETAITRRQNRMCDTLMIFKKYFNFDNSHFWE